MTKHPARSVKKKPTSGHTVAWTIYDNATVGATFTCHEPEGAPCREYCQGTHCSSGIIECDNCDLYRHEPRTDRHCAHCGTPIGPVKCIKVEWMENDGGVETYGGPTVPLRDGPVEFVWQLDYFEWHYKEKP